MRVIAQKRNAFLVALIEEGQEVDLENGLGRIYDPGLNRLYSPFPLKEIYQTGNWEEPQGEVPDIDSLIAEDQIEQVAIMEKVRLGQDKSVTTGIDGNPLTP